MLGSISNLRWEIKPGEQKDQKKQEFWALLNLLPYFGLFLLIELNASGNNSFFRNLESVFVILAITIAVLYIRYKFGRDKEKAYFLSEQGLTISKGDKTKSYKWNDFECYYLYKFTGRGLENKDNNIPSREVGGMIIGAEQRLEKINGKTYHLKKRSSGILGKFIKTFVVVQAEPDNSMKVNEFLSKHLNLEKMTNTSDLGLVSYEFK